MLCSLLTSGETIHRPRAESFRTDTYANPRGGSGLWREIWSPRLAVYAKHTHPALTLTTRCSETVHDSHPWLVPARRAAVRCMQSTGPRHAKHTGQRDVLPTGRKSFVQPAYIIGVNYCSCSRQDRA